MDRLPIDATMGERIRYYRQIAGLTQKALAEKCGITESAIRNYELSNRMPDWDTLSAIAAHLEVSFYALSDPKLNAIFGALHALFNMEEIYGLHPETVGNKVHLVFDKNAYSKNPLNFSANALLSQAVTVWEHNYRQYTNGKMTEEEYRTWKSKYPDFAAPDGTSLASETGNDETPTPLEPKKRFRRPKKMQ